METDKGVFDVSEQKPKFHKWFHNFLIYFALWAYALVAMIQGFLEIQFVVQNDPSFGGWFVIVLAVLLMLVGAFLIKVRFDLAKFRPQAPMEMLVACIAAAVLLVLIGAMLYWAQADDFGNRLYYAVVVTVWGLVLYRYYNERPYLFEGAVK